MGRSRDVCVEPHKLRPLIVWVAGVFSQMFIVLVISEVFKQRNNSQEDKAERVNDDDSELGSQQLTEDEEALFDYQQLGGSGRDDPEKNEEPAWARWNLIPDLDAMLEREEREQRMSGLEMEQDKSCTRITNLVLLTAKTLGNGLVIFKIVSIWTVFVLDMITFTTERKRDRGDSWHNYMCLGEILLTSSNCKTIFISFLPAVVDLGVRRSQSSWVRTCYLWTLFISILFYVPVIITHLIPSLVFYIWVILSLMLAFACAHHICVRLGYEKVRTEKIFWFRNPLGILYIYSVMCIPSLIMLYWYSEKFGYIGSVLHVFALRNWEKYWARVMRDRQTMMQFITAIF